MDKALRDKGVGIRVGGPPCSVGVSTRKVESEALTFSTLLNGNALGHGPVKNPGFPRVISSNEMFIPAD